MGLGLRVQVVGLGFRAEGSGCRVQDLRFLGFRAEGSGCRVQDLRFLGLGLRVQVVGFRI